MTIDSAINARARRQHGLITRRQLAATGLTSGAIAKRVTSGRLHRLHRGVYAVGHDGLSDLAKLLAAVLACGPGAVLSGAHAAGLHGVWRRKLPDRPCVLVPRRHEPVDGVDVRFCRSLPKRDTTVRFGIPTATLERVVVDLASHNPADVLANVIYEAMHQRGRLSIPSLERCIDAHKHRRGPVHRRLVAALALYHSGSTGRKSEGEGAVYSTLVERGHHDVLFNVQFDPRDGDEPWYPDFRFPRARLIVEIDGATSHGRPPDVKRDREREIRAAARGFRTIRFSSDEAWRRPARVVDAIETSLQTRLHDVRRSASPLVTFPAAHRPEGARPFTHP